MTTTLKAIATRSVFTDGVNSRVYHSDTSRSKSNNPITNETAKLDSLTLKT